ncbi:hypothetical protein IFM89_021783 [Coptis chinensis]|uniref:Uncharacterized protein n=1 Tax=Coptis chinensis TaxID=261450 RepID=A0A835IQF9_9MAGN|nr:hypothetical protein IFM89_021783 [Coptis chinensis]
MLLECQREVIFLLDRLESHLTCSGHDETLSDSSYIQERKKLFDAEERLGRKLDMEGSGNRNLEQIEKTLSSQPSNRQQIPSQIDSSIYDSESLTTDDDPPLETQKSGLNGTVEICSTVHTCIAPDEPEEIEMILVYPENHTMGFSGAERYKSLVETVACHFSLLKNMFPSGITRFSFLGLEVLTFHCSNLVFR